MPSTGRKHVTHNTQMNTYYKKSTHIKTKYIKTYTQSKPLFFVENAQDFSHSLLTTFKRTGKEGRA